QELGSLGAQAIEPGFCGVAFECDRALLYKVNLWARLPFRILVQLAELPAGDAVELRHSLQTIDWAAYLTPEQTLAVKATGKNRQLNHTHFTALQVKNAIVDQQTAAFGERSDVDTELPDVLVNVHVQREHCVVSLDSSGSSLHRRGYRPAMGAAPLKESLAAALIQLSDWTPDLPFFDPLCGSGTLPIEACLQALKIAPGLFREQFGFETWPDFDEDLWEQLQQDARGVQRENLPAVIGGCDRSPDVIEQARINAQRSGVIWHIQLACQDLAEVEAPADQGVIICNPPYGERLSNKAELGDFYKLLGDVFKQRFKGWTAYVLSGNKELSRTIGLKSAQRFPVYNGALPCQLMKYELY
ncbi:MAG: RNA methyltransferase, partial [Leptolyngbya sp. SIO4C1]|nr:RNA methyltransferase [Leptolyngbya sp. SIO4C1]